MSRFFRPLVAWLVLMAGVLAPSVASAVTVEQIVELSRSGVTEAVILALIDRDKTIFALEPEQLVTLKAQGVSDTVILAMLKNGREEGERAAQAAAELNSNFIMSTLPSGPEVVVVGHEPDVPNGGWSPATTYPGFSGEFAIPYLYGYGYGYGYPYLRRRPRLAPPVAFSDTTAAGVPLHSPFTAPRQSPFTAPFVSPFHQPPVERPIPIPQIKVPPAVR
ncbi:MAG TPA: hypothetical protein VKE51_00775 [Vicinamibacterales bacterium]|nr:hypothetical protein [Vicinamibacterales bacterium]